MIGNGTECELAQLKQELSAQAKLLNALFVSGMQKESFTPTTRVVDAKKKLEKATELLGFRKQYPELEDDFARLAKAQTSAEARMEQFAEIRGVAI